MRISGQLLRRVCHLPLEETEFLDLSGKEIVAIEKLAQCCRLQTLVLANNSIDVIRNVDCCRHLWKIDLTGNMVKNVDGLSRFPVLGCLGLAYNQLDWHQVGRLSHIHLLSLTLVGNPKLDSDPHYREHVTDLLPHLWSLDGRMITAAERREVSHFFSSSEASLHPVRRKGSGNVFVPTTLKNLLVTGVFGDKTCDLMSHFPVKYVHNVEMDQRRLQYLASVWEEEMSLESSSRYRNHQVQEIPGLVELLVHRREEVEQCNMLLLLLLAGLEFGIPADVMRATLETAKLTKIGEVDCVELLSLPVDMMLTIASVLLSATAVDREEKKDGGLYSHLFKSLCYTMDELQRRYLSEIANRSTVNLRRLSPVEEATTTKLRCILASEVVHLMCLVPLFFEAIEASEGLMEMIAVATKNPHVADVIGAIAWKVQQRGGDVWEVYHDVASYLLQATSENVPGRKKFRRHPSSLMRRTMSQVIQTTRLQSHTHPPRSLSAGTARTSGRLRRQAATRSAKLRSERKPELGDLVLVDQERVARIVALPETQVAVLQLNPRSSRMSSPPDSYFYTDTGGLVWDRQMGYWTKDDLTADLSSGHLPGSPEPPFTQQASTVSLETSSVRLGTPDLPSLPTTRPHSQLSFYSDDLEPILSQEELTVDGGNLDHPPMRVDISDRPGGGSAKSGLSRPPQSHGDLEAARMEHQRHIIHQYTTQEKDQHTHTNPKTEDPAATIKQPQPPHPIPPSSSTTQAFSAHQEESLIVPTPQIHLLDTWETAKSLPSTTHPKLHSCRQTQERHLAAGTRPDSRPTSSASPTHPPPSTSPTLTSTISSLSLRSTGSPVGPYQEPPVPVLYSAWTAVKPNAHTKHTLLTSSRLMSKRKPKSPPTTRKHSKSAPLTLGSAHSSRGSDTVVLRPQPPTSVSALLRDRTQHPDPVVPPHLRVSTAHSLRATSQNHFHPRKSGRVVPTTRRLGDVRGIYIGGTSLM